MPKQQEYKYAFSGEDKYCYPGTSVLRNRQDIRAQDALMVAEREITSLKLLMLRKKPLSEQFDFAHLRAIHCFLFGDIYEWAGEIRQGDFLSKGSTLFCLGRYIESNAKKIFADIVKENKLRGLEKHKFVEKLVYYMGEVNALHPFREGNGRTTREYFRQLSEYAGYDLDLGGVNKDELLTADIAAFDGDYAPLASILDAAVKTMPPA
jgi:cell filamentation protein